MIQDESTKIIVMTNTDTIKLETNETIDQNSSKETIAMIQEKSLELVPEPEILKDVYIYDNLDGNGKVDPVVKDRDEEPTLKKKRITKNEPDPI